MRRNPASRCLGILGCIGSSVGWNVWKSELICRPQQLDIAVLPFENLSEEKANAYFTDGVQDEILTNLAKIADLKVISRTSRHAV